MSTRVFKPISATEIPKIRSSPMLEGRLSSYRGVQKVRRALFHPNPDETKRFLRDEFAKLATYESDRWDFDFVEGKPKPLVGCYEWTLFTERPKLDVMIAPIKQFLKIQNNSEQFYPPIESSSESNFIDDAEMMTELSTIPSTRTIIMSNNKKQSLITDFMQVRKRIEERSLKKLDGTPSPSSSRPQKKARMSLVDSAS